MAEAPTDSTVMRLTSPAGMRAEINANGSIRRFDFADICLPLFVGNELEGGPANLYLRSHADGIEWTPLLGPLSRTRFRADSGSLQGIGSWHGINYSIALVLAAEATAWLCHPRLENVHLPP